jgi:hypothetical protein
MPSRRPRSNRRRQQRRHSWRALWGVWLALGLLLGLCLGPAIAEEAQLALYRPPAPVAQLAHQTSMSAKGRRIFYLTQPTITADSPCHRRYKEQTIILGCYSSQHNAIAIQPVTDGRLEGTMQVTAAHEMLHAAYHRLSASERKWIDQQVTTAFQQVTDERVQKTVARYRQQSPEVVINELHSILGTEVETLPADLERYYQRYFVDRAPVVAFAQRSAQPFSQIYHQAETAQHQLDAMATEIERLRAIRTSQTDPQERQATTEILQQQIDAYNATVDRYNGLVSEDSGLRQSMGGRQPRER